MKIEEKNQKKLWRRGNVLDVAIVLLLIAAIATIGYRYYRSTNDSADADLKNVVITYEVVQAPASMAEAIQPAQAIYLQSAKTLLGTALDITLDQDSGTVFEVTKVFGETVDENGNPVTVEMPYVNLVGGVFCQGTVDENGTFLLDGRTPITPGQLVSVYTETVEYTFTVLTISTWED